ncbi:hypothetical protein LCGC14_2260060, partial [marine sediment metagenome]
MVFAVDFLFRRTKFGIAMRATSDSRELAQISGINTKRIVLYTWFIAGGITGFGATFYRANLPKFDSFTGFLLLLPIFAVVILGGVGSFRGGIIAALIYGFVRQAFFIILTEFQKDGGIEDMLSNIEIPSSIRVVKEFNENLPTILGDPDQIIPVFRNIILNAIQAMDKGGNLIIKTTTPSSERVSISI